MQFNFLWQAISESIQWVCCSVLSRKNVIPMMNNGCSYFNNQWLQFHSASWKESQHASFEEKQEVAGNKKSHWWQEALSKNWNPRAVSCQLSRTASALHFPFRTKWHKTHQWKCFVKKQQILKTGQSSSTLTVQPPGKVKERATLLLLLKKKKKKKSVPQEQHLIVTPTNSSYYLHYLGCISCRSW